MLVLQCLWIFAAIAAGSASIAWCETPLETSEVVATGVGIGVDDALKNAFSRAVESTVGLVVDAETLIENDVLIKEQILTYSDAIVQSYEEVSSRILENGLHEITIRARVKKKQLVQRLKESGISVTEVDTTSIYSQIVTEEKAEQGAWKLLEARLQKLDFPSSYLRARVTSEVPQLLDSTETTATVQWAIEVSIDQELYYSAFVPELTSLLDEISKESSDRPVPRDGQNPTGGNDSLSLLLNAKVDRNLAKDVEQTGILSLVTRSNKSGDNFSVSFYGLEGKPWAALWNYFFPLVDESTDFINGKRRARLPRLAVDIVGANEEIIIQSVIDLEDVKPQGKNAFYYGAINREKSFPSLSRGSGLRLAPYIYGDFWDGHLYGGPLRFGLSREMDLEELKQVKSVRCSFLIPEQ